MTHEDTTTDSTPESVLVGLAQLYLRTAASPLPKHPAAFGWQMIAGVHAAAFAHALHALNGVAPETAADIASWYEGPFGDGPDPIDTRSWFAEHIARSTAEFTAWANEAATVAQEANQPATSENGAAPEADAVHKHFGLSYANYMVLPRTLLQSMPDAWQAQFVQLLSELEDAFETVPQAEAYIVQAATEQEVWTLDALERTAARVTPNDDSDDTTFTHTSLIGETTELDPSDVVLVPAVDPVPHYNRGRTRVPTKQER